MVEGEFDEVRAFWDRVAGDWLTQVGDEGDANRRLNSDPVIWSFVGDVGGLTVLDAGCGTGYLSRQLANRGAHVIGVDVSPRMIEIAQTRHPKLQFQVDSCTELATIPDESCDVVVANYVLMDIPDLIATMHAFNRVLTLGGIVVAVLSHPCFPQGRSVESAVPNGVLYDWNFSYFEPSKRIDPPWGHFTSEFIWFHRPLSDYWKAFVAGGFDVLEFEEPRITEERYHLASSSERLNKSKHRPYSVAFKLEKCRSPV